jgi:acyl-coenzyme A thioesterase PaaI-like protein
MLGFMVPYTGALGAGVMRFDPGHVQVRLRERRGVRNHLRSVHAIALANMGELATGLALVGSLPPTVRGILVRLEIDYRKKARGTLVAEARCVLPHVTEACEHAVEAEVRDAAGEAVALVRAHWRLAPVADGAGPRVP